jgi:hypothetical protein
MKHPHFLEGDPCPIPGCPGRFIRDSAAHPTDNGDFFRCDTCHLLDDDAEEIWSPIGQAARRVCAGAKERTAS